MKNYLIHQNNQTMEAIKPHFLVDHVNPRTITIREEINQTVKNKILKTFEANDSNIKIVCGGDGFMLDSIRNNYQDKQAFFGMNFGTEGHLLNGIKSIKYLPKSRDDLDIFEQNFINIEIEVESGKIIHKKAAGDVTIGGNVLDFFRAKIIGEHGEVDTGGTAIVVSNAFGSTGYWLNLNRPYIPLDMKVWGVSGMATGNFQHEIIDPQKLEIFSTCRHELLCGADGYGGKVDNIKKVTITPSYKSFKIAFLKSEQFEKKRLMKYNEIIRGTKQSLNKGIN